MAEGTNGLRICGFLGRTSAHDVPSSASVELLTWSPLFLAPLRRRALCPSSATRVGDGRAEGGALSLQGTSGGHGILGHNQGNLGGPGSPWGQGHPGGSEGSFGTNSVGGSAGQGGSAGSSETAAQVSPPPRPPLSPHPSLPGSSSPTVSPSLQGAVAQPGYGSVRGSSQNSGVRRRVWG